MLKEDAAMPEGILEEVLGGEDERADHEAAEVAHQADAFASAVAARLSANDPEVSRRTAAFLAAQTALIEVQKVHLEQEHSLRVRSLRNQVTEQGLRRFGLRLRTTFQLLLASFMAALALGLLIMVYDAFHSKNVVIDQFEAPPQMSSQGLNGKVLAGGMLDVLTQIQVATRSSADHPSLSTGWANDISIEIPETGLSIEQIERVLKTRFGHDTHIDGDLVQSHGGALALTVRGTGILPRTFTGQPDKLDDLLRQAGEYLYGQSQPGLWAWYLGDKGRGEEAIAFSQEMYPRANPVEKPYVLNAWANAIVVSGASDANHRALALYREALRLKPDYFVAYYNVMQMLTNVGEEDAVISVGQQLLKRAGGRPGRGDENLYQYWDAAVWNLRKLRDGFVSDMESHGGLGSITGSNGSENLSVALIDVFLHDPEAAKVRLQTTAVDPNSAPDVAAAALAKGLLAYETHDIAEAARQMDILTQAYREPVVRMSSANIICFAVPVFEAAGQNAAADAALSAVGSLRFLDCSRFRGDLSDARGDWAQAQRWYAQAVELAPSLPAGYFSWGVARAKHGDLSGAIDMFAKAHERGPNWADPLKAWGDVLVKQSKPKEALAKYDQAMAAAPQWQELSAVRSRLSAELKKK
jgi:tetratricopeptide (TPR) repeat protein